MNERWKRMALGAFFGHLILALYMVERVCINADEGWYLYAAGMVSQGLRLHQDLLFFQAPVMVFVYGGLLDFGPGMLLGARWISLLFVLLSVGLTALTAVRRGGPQASVIAVLLVGLHPLFVGAGVWAKPYALSVLLLAGGVFVWSGPQRPVRVAIGALLFGLAAGTRLTLLPIPLLAIWAADKRGWSALGATAGLVLAFRKIMGVPLPVLWTQLVEVHLPEGGEALWLVSERLALMMHLSLLLSGFLSVAVLSRLGRGRRSDPVGRLCVASVLCVGALNLLPGALHVEHVIVLMPMLGILASDWSSQVPQRAWAWCTVAGCVAVGSLASLRFVQLDSAGSTLAQAAEVGKELRSEIPPGKKLLTLQLTLAVEAGRRVPSGFEMGRFGWSLGGLDREGVMAAMNDDIGAIALADGDFADDPLLRLAFRGVLQQQGRTRMVDSFGQFGEELVLGLPNAPSVVLPEKP